MKKLRIEDIRVDSYTTEEVSSVHGTVKGNAATLLCQTYGASCRASDCNSCATNQWCC